MIARLTLALAALVSFGCGSAASYQTVPMADAVSEAPQADTCRVYIARSGQMTGSVRSVEINQNGARLAELGTNAYLCMDLPASRSVIQVIYHGPVVDQRLDGRQVEDVLAFDAEPGVTYWFRLHLDPKTKMPIFDRLGEEEGRALIDGRKPAEVRSKG